jgi:hypothetical protein
MLAVVVAVAVGIRLIFELLEPVMPYLLAGLIVFTVFRLVRWYRERW